MDGTIEYPLLKPEELAGNAWAAMGRQDADEALLMWRALREHSPERPEGYIWPIPVLWQSGRFAEAEEMAAAAFARFPDHPEISVQHAWIAAAQQHWDEAAERWARVRDSAPERIEGYAWGARALWQGGRADEAETVVTAGLARTPENPEVMTESAWTATARQDWQAAVGRWIRVQETHPERLDARLGAMRALRMVGRLDEAEALATASLALHPGDTDLLMEQVWVAVARGDWPAIAQSYEHARGSAQKTLRGSCRASNGSASGSTRPRFRHPRSRRAPRRWARKRKPRRCRRTR